MALQSRAGAVRYGRVPVSMGSLATVSLSSHARESLCFQRVTGAVSALEMSFDADPAGEPAFALEFMDAGLRSLQGERGFVL